MDYPVRADLFRKLVESQNIHDPASVKDPERLALLKQMMRGYVATTDASCCEFYRELMEIYPNAKVLLTVRDSADVWW